MGGSRNTMVNIVSHTCSIIPCVLHAFMHTGAHMAAIVQTVADNPYVEYGLVFPVVARAVLIIVIIGLPFVLLQSMPLLEAAFCKAKPTCRYLWVCLGIAAPPWAFKEWCAQIACIMLPLCLVHCFSLVPHHLGTPVVLDCLPSHVWAAPNQHCACAGMHPETTFF